MKEQLFLKVLEMLIVEKVSTDTAADNGPQGLRQMIGKYVLVRHHFKGVNVGVLESVDASGFTLKDSRQLWRWQAAQGLSLESVVLFGIKNGTRATAIVGEIYIPLQNLCGIMTVENKEIIQQLKTWPISDQD